MSDQERHELWSSATGDAPRADVRRRALAAALGALEESAPGPVRLRRRLGVRYVALGTGALAVAAAIAVVVGRGSAGAGHGDITAEARTEVSIGGRARVALEPSTHIAWSSPDDVIQSSGSAFYRVEPGATFRVHTPAGDVTVLGTCFRIKVRSTGEVSMNGRDVKAGVVGAVTAAFAFVAVYEGKVSASHAGQTVELTNGEAADLRLGSGPRKDADGSGAERAFDSRAALPAADEALNTANQDLVRQVGEYRTRLEGIAAQKADLEDKLKKSEQALAASEGHATPSKQDFDPSPDEWRDLAKSGSVKYTTPCFGSRAKPWSPSNADLDKAGLAPSDRPAIESAYAHANEQIWATVMPLCAAAVGGVEAANKLGLDACRQVIIDTEATRDPQAAFQARRLVGEIRAGTKPLPGPNDPLNPITKLYLALTGSTKSLEAELAQSFGPAEAHRLVSADGMCVGTHSHSEPPPADK
jgi:hypothetical protein